MIDSGQYYGINITYTSAQCEQFALDLARQAYSQAQDEYLRMLTMLITIVIGLSILTFIDNYPKIKEIWNKLKTELTK